MGCVGMGWDRLERMYRDGIGYNERDGMCRDGMRWVGIGRNRIE